MIGRPTCWNRYEVKLPSAKDATVRLKVTTKDFKAVDEIKDIKYQDWNIKLSVSKPFIFLNVERCALLKDALTEACYDKCHDILRNREFR